MKSNGFTDFLTGLFMIAVLALMAYFTIVISGVDLLCGRRRARVNVTFQGVGGLKDHDSVMYRGMKVGTVESIELTSSNLVAHLDVSSDVVLREGCVARVCSLSLLGGNYLALEEGAGEVVRLDGLAVRGEESGDLMRDLAQVARNLNRITSDGALRGIVTNVERVSARLDSIVARLERGEGMVGKLLSSDETAYDNLTNTLANASVASGQMRTALKGSDEIVPDLKKAIAGFRDACATFDKSCASFDLGATKDDVQKAAALAKDAAAGAKALMASLNGVAQKLERGEGTLGKLISEDALHEEVKGLVRDIRQIIDNYRDTTPISTFSSLATGAL